MTHKNFLKKEFFLSKPYYREVELLNILMVDGTGKQTAKLERVRYRYTYFFPIYP